MSVQPDKVKDTEVGVSQVIEKKENQRKETILETVSEEGLEKQAEAVKLETKTQDQATQIGAAGRNKTDGAV